MKKVKYLIIALILMGTYHANAQNGTANAGLNQVLASYLDIKNALATDNSKLANQKATEFTAALKAVNAGKLDAKQKTTWLAYSEKLRFDGDHISESQKIDHQREHFTSLSKNMFTVVKALKANKQVIYQQYCPMKKASWLSETMAIKNPYYGKEMLECGQTKETLKANP
ncbi:DUF3347 domain-containing protein [Mucilaginibacter paludis]|nr:DUF3347 domain-containing protein [Mucilaginibacter paludis]